MNKPKYFKYSENQKTLVYEYDFLTKIMTLKNCPMNMRNGKCAVQTDPFYFKGNLISFKKPSVVFCVTVTFKHILTYCA